MLGIHLIDNIFECIGIGVTVALFLHMYIMFAVSRKPKRRVQTTRLK